MGGGELESVIESVAVSVELPRMSTVASCQRFRGDSWSTESLRGKVIAEEETCRSSDLLPADWLVVMSPGS